MNESTFTIYNEDCIEGLAERVASDSVDLCVSSIPFSDLFVYSGKLEDVGNVEDGADSRASMFGLNLRFFIHQLYRVIKPGRNACIHIQQLVAYGNKHGYVGRRDFNGAVRDMFMAGGFDFFGEVVIPKNPQIIAKRSNLHSLMFATGYRNSVDLAPACNDYVLVFKKPGDCEVPVRALYDRDKNPGGWVTTDEWIKWAHGVWTDIKETDVLSGWRASREPEDDKHVCPLQLEVIRRCVRLYSNPGEVVLDPFMGIGSTAAVAIEQRRSALGFEIKDSWYRQCLRNCERATATGPREQLGLLDLLHELDAAGQTEEVTA